MGDKTSKEYFEFIENPKDLIGATRKYIEYYPQHDWKNFLQWPELIK